MCTIRVLAADSRSPIGASTVAISSRRACDVVAVAVHEDDEIVRVADDPPVRQALRATSAAPARRCSSPRPAATARAGAHRAPTGRCWPAAGTGCRPAACRCGCPRSSPSSVRTPALRNALTSASTRLSLTRRRTRSIRAGCVDGVEARLDVRVQHPPVTLGAEQVDLGDRVVRPPLRPEPVGDRHEVGLEDRFQHQLQRRLDDPVGDRSGCPSLRSFPDPPGLGILRSRTGSGRNVPVLQLGTQIVQEPGHPDARSTSATVRPSTPAVFGPGVARDPVERHDQRRRVVHEVEQVVEPAARIGRRPTVKLGLHLRYPRPRPDGPSTGAPPFSGASFGIAASIPSRYRCRPSPCARALPGSEYYGGSAPSRPDQRTTRPARPAALDARQRARPGRFPCSLLIRSTKEEPDSVPAASPRLPRSTSPWPPGRPPKTHPGVPRPHHRTGAHRSRPISARFEPVQALRDVNAGSSRTPFRHARRTRTIWQYWHVPALSGLLPPSPAPPGSGCPQLHRPAATGRRRRSLTSTRINSASRRTQRRLKTDPVSTPGGQNSGSGSISVMRWVGVASTGCCAGR